MSVPGPKRTVPSNARTAGDPHTADAYPAAYVLNIKRGNAVGLDPRVGVHPLRDSSLLFRFTENGLVGCDIPCLQALCAAAIAKGWSRSFQHALLYRTHAGTHFFGVVRKEPA